jgi:hypothetical protein
MQKRKLVASLDEFNEIMVQVGVKLVTILVPLPSAVALFNAMADEVGWLGAFIMALVIELFGLAAVDNNYLSWLNKDKVDPRVSYAVTAGYVVVAECVIAAFKVFNHTWVNAVYLLFPLLSIMGFVLLMNRRTIDDVRRQDDTEQLHNQTVQSLRNQIEQLNNQVAQLAAQNAEVRRRNEQLELNNAVEIEQPKVYKNGDILHGLEHLGNHDKIHAIAQRMSESIGKVNKSEIARLCKVSRGTVQNVLGVSEA